MAFVCHPVWNASLLPKLKGETRYVPQTLEKDSKNRLTN